MGGQKKIAIVDDHALMAFALQSLIAAELDLRFDRHARTVAQLTATPYEVDLVVLDLSLRDGTSPEENVRRLTEWGAHVLVLTSAENPFLVRAASRTSALGIMRKSAPPDVLIDAIRCAASGNPVVSAEWASALDTDPGMDGAPLTAREREVLGLYASGLGAKEVAGRLFVSPNTIDDHIRRIRSIYQQLGRPAATKVELYQRGIEDGYVPAPSRDERLRE